MPFYAGLDVTDDVLDDDDFNAPIWVFSTSVVVGAGGLAAITSLTPGGNFTMASVTPNAGYVLIQTDQGNNIQGDIDIITRYPLSTGGRDREPDVVIWNDDPYRLIAAKPYLYGRGFTHAVGKLATVNPNDHQALGSGTDVPKRGALG